MNDIQRLRNTAQYNREHIKYKTFIAKVDGRNYAFKIMGVGNKAIRLNIFLDYEDILKNKEVGLEKILHEMINKVY